MRAPWGVNEPGLRIVVIMGAPVGEEELLCPPFLCSPDLQARAEPGLQISRSSGAFDCPGPDVRSDRASHPFTVDSAICVPAVLPPVQTATVTIPESGKVNLDITLKK